MKQFYETYSENEKLSLVVREITWTNNLIILTCETLMEKEFYIRMVIKEKWSKSELQRQINSSYYERVMLADAKLSPFVRELKKKVSKKDFF